MPPRGTGYDDNKVRYTVGLPINPNRPLDSLGGTVTGYAIDPALPPGLVFDTHTGIISGTPKQLSPEAIYTVTFTNSGGDVHHPLAISVVDVVPSDLRYPPGPFEVERLRPTAPLAPVSIAGGTPTNFSVTPPLPAGLSISNQGVITGSAEIASPSTNYTIVALNSGGLSNAVVVNLAVTFGPLRFGVPASTPEHFTVALSKYLANYSDAGGGVRIAVEVYDDFTLTATDALETRVADVAIAPALLGFMGWKRLDHQVLAVAADHDGATSNAVKALVRKSSGLSRWVQLRGVRACQGGFLSPGHYAPVSWATTTQNTSDFPRSSSTALLEDCDSPLLQVSGAFFSASCAPPTSPNPGRVGMCDVCPVGEGRRCDARNPYAGDEGALRGLSEGVCDVAFVREGVWERVCGKSYYVEGAPLQGLVPAWCVGSEQLSHLQEPGGRSGFGLVPSDALMYRSGALTQEASDRLLEAVLQMEPELASMFGGASSFKAVSSNSDPSGSQTATALHLGGDFETLATNVPGVQNDLACVLAGKCVTAHAPKDCPNLSSLGLVQQNPVRYGFPKNIAQEDLKTLERCMQLSSPSHPTCSIIFFSFFFNSCVCVPSPTLSI